MLRIVVKTAAAADVAGRLLGYARVSTDDQATDQQACELRAAGCVEVVEEFGSGADRERPALAELLKGVRAGDTLVVVRLDRLARSVSHLLSVIEGLKKKGAHFRSLRDPIDTLSPQGMLSLQVLGAVAEFERSLIAERTVAGLKHARAQGRVGGNPGLRSGDAAEVRKVSDARDAAHLARVVAGLDEWLPTVRRMRPVEAWGDVVRVLNQGCGAGEEIWTQERLRRTVILLVRAGIVGSELLDRARPQKGEDRLVRLVRGLRVEGPDRTLAEIAAQLEGMRERTPRGGTRWHPSSVAHLLKRADREVSGVVR